MRRVDVAELTERDARALAAALNPLVGAPAEALTDTDRRVEAYRSALPKRRLNHIRHQESA